VEHREDKAWQRRKTNRSQYLSKKPVSAGFSAFFGSGSDILYWASHPVLPPFEEPQKPGFGKNNPKNLKKWANGSFLLKMIMIRLRHSKKLVKTR
jgi:hypothetical protein